MDPRDLCPDECPRKAEKLCNPCISGVGPKDAKIVLVGENPDRMEDEDGIPFVGQKGRLLNSILYSLGLERKDIYITNSVKCYVNKEDPKPSQKEIKFCRRLLEEELKEIKPVVIGVLGATALKSVLNRTGIAKLKNNVFFSEEFNCKVVPTFHPAYILRNPHEHGQLVEGIKLIAKESTYVHMDTSQQEGNKHLIATTKEQIEKILDALEKQNHFVFDLETTSLDYFKAEILCVALSWKEYFGAVIPWDKLKEFSLLDRFVAVLQSNRLKINHNIKFDVQVLKGNKICCKGPFFDTMLAHHLIDENTKHGLDELTLRYLDLGEYWGDLEKVKTEICKEKKIAKEDFSYGMIPSDILYPYAACDADATYRLYKKFSAEMDRQGLTQFFNDHTMAFMPVLMYMEFRGIKIDREKLAGLIKESREQIVEMEKTFFENEDVKKYEASRRVVAMKKLGDKYNDSKMLKSRYPNGLEEYAAKVMKEEDWRFNFHSPKQLQELFFKQMRLPVIKRTDTGLSVDVEVLGILAKDHGVKFAEQLVAYRKLTKYCSTYLESVYEKSEHDGRIHTTYQQHLTVSGRLSSKSPNLQNISRDAKDFKSCFVSDPGYVFVKSDLGQAEFRCWAHYSGDEDMIRDIDLVDKGLLPDIHTLLASEVFNVPVSEISKKDPRRTAAKNCVFGLMYGRGTQAISIQYNITLEQAEQIKASFFARYPVAARWLKDIVEEAREKGAVKTWFGRIRRLPKIHSDNMGDRAEAERQAQNSPIQGQASDMNNAYMMRIWKEAKRRGIDCYPAATIHDDNTLQVKEDQADQLIEVMKWVVDNAFPDFKCKMVLEFKKGNNLGYMEDVK